ncbi:hypothetical protein C8J57DRAFT_1225132 [Mycena rebaudengoi]|nr:hypothetical protein C8J57DRAFT_1225132 [Mycena rebaudengoi]
MVSATRAHAPRCVCPAWVLDAESESNPHALIWPFMVSVTRAHAPRCACPAWVLDAGVHMDWAWAWTCDAAESESNPHALMRPESESNPTRSFGPSWSLQLALMRLGALAPPGCSTLVCIWIGLGHGLAMRQVLHALGDLCTAYVGWGGRGVRSGGTKMTGAGRRGYRVSWFRDMTIGNICRIEEGGRVKAGVRFRDGCPRNLKWSLMAEDSWADSGFWSEPDCCGECRQIDYLRLARAALKVADSGGETAGFPPCTLGDTRMCPNASMRWGAGWVSSRLKDAEVDGLGRMRWGVIRKTVAESAMRRYEAL